MNLVMLFAKTVLPRHAVLISFSILFLYPLLPSALQTIAIGLFSITTLALYHKSFASNWLGFTWKPLLVSAGWFLILCVTVVYSTEKGKGFDYIVRGLSLIVFPFLLLYFVPKLSKKQKALVVFSYVVVHIFLVFFVYYKIAIGIDALGYIDDAGNRVMGFSKESHLEQFIRIAKMPFSLSRYYLNENNITTFFIHKAYLSMGYVWCIFLLVYIIVKEDISIPIKLLLGIISLFFALVVLYFTSVPNVVALAILLPIYLCILLKGVRRRVIFVGSFIVSLFILSQIPFVREKIIQDDRLLNGISETKKMIVSIVKDEPSYGSNIRIQVWKCAYEVISEQFFWGYGIGSEPKVLKECYDKKKCRTCSDYAFNSHNQYATFMVNGGAMALLVFLFAMIYCIRLAYVRSNWLYLFFLMLFLINLVGESMFVRIHGILFFALFNSAFFAELCKEKIISREQKIANIKTEKG